MQSEELSASLHERNIEVKSSLYTSPDHSLFQGFCRSLPATIRLQRIASEAKAIEVEAEVEILRTLRHANVLKVLDCWKLRQEKDSYVVIVSEHCAQTGQDEMDSRYKSKKFLEEEKLWALCISLVGAFSYLQRRGYAHRLISPSSLYIYNDDWKVGNLTASTVASSVISLRAQKGHGNYHSPYVCDALLRGQPPTAHNEYKSDVYSLGLTLLALARLEEPAVITGTGHLAEVITEEVGKCRYTDNFKEVLLAMLKTEEEERGDFVQFESWLGARPASLPASSLEVKLQEKDSESVQERPGNAERPGGLERPRDLERPGNVERPEDLERPKDLRDVEMAKGLAGPDRERSVKEADKKSLSDYSPHHASEAEPNKQRAKASDSQRCCSLL